MASILAKNPNAKIFPISAQAHQGIEDLLRELKQVCFLNIERARNHATINPLETVSREGYDPSEASEPRDGGREQAGSREDLLSEVPTITLSPKALKSTWKATKISDDLYEVTGEKIEKFARRTDLNNYASVNRLRDIMKKLGIRAELTNLGAKPDSIIRIAGKEFTLVEDY